MSDSPCGQSRHKGASRTEHFILQKAASKDEVKNWPRSQGKGNLEKLQLCPQFHLVPTEASGESGSSWMGISAERNVPSVCSLQAPPALGLVNTLEINSRLRH